MHANGRSKRLSGPVGHRMVKGVSVNVEPDRAVPLAIAVHSPYAIIMYLLIVLVVRPALPRWTLFPRVQARRYERSSVRVLLVHLRSAGQRLDGSDHAGGISQSGTARRQKTELTCSHKQGYDLTLGARS